MTIQVDLRPEEYGKSRYEVSFDSGLTIKYQGQIVVQSAGSVSEAISDLSSHLAFTHPSGTGISFILDRKADSRFTDVFSYVENEFNEGVLKRNGGRFSYQSLEDLTGYLEPRRISIDRIAEMIRKHESVPFALSAYDLENNIATYDVSIDKDGTGFFVAHRGELIAQGMATVADTIESVAYHVSSYALRDKMGIRFSLDRNSERFRDHFDYTSKQFDKNEKDEDGRIPRGELIEEVARCVRKDEVVKVSLINKNLLGARSRSQNCYDWMVGVCYERNVPIERAIDQIVEKLSEGAVIDPLLRLRRDSHEQLFRDSVIHAHENESYDRGLGGLIRRRVEYGERMQRAAEYAAEKIGSDLWFGDPDKIVIVKFERGKQDEYKLYFFDRHFGTGYLPAEMGESGVFPTAEQNLELLLKNGGKYSKLGKLLGAFLDSFGIDPMRQEIVVYEKGKDFERRNIPLPTQEASPLNEREASVLKRFVTSHLERYRQANDRSPEAAVRVSRIVRKGLDRLCFYEDKNVADIIQVVKPQSGGYLIRVLPYLADDVPENWEEAVAPNIKAALSTVVSKYFPAWTAIDASTLPSGEAKYFSPGFIEEQAEKANKKDIHSSATPEHSEEEPDLVREISTDLGVYLAKEALSKVGVKNPEIHKAIDRTVEAVRNEKKH